LYCKKYQEGTRVGQPTAKTDKERKTKLNKTKFFFSRKRKGLFLFHFIEKEEFWGCRFDLSKPVEERGVVVASKPGQCVLPDLLGQGALNEQMAHGLQFLVAKQASRMM
jgi:hypothetical protein